MMLKAITTLTCLTFITIYILLVQIAYPYVCWIKHRPSDDDYRLIPPVATVIRRRFEQVCSTNYQLDVMPMPWKNNFSDKINFISIPSIIRIETTRTLPFTTVKSSLNASFILSIDYQHEMTNQSYPDMYIDESYQLNITSKDRASLFARTYVGIIRGLSTFKQLQRQEQLAIPLTISDRPHRVWRGVMLDVSRHFIPIPIIKQTIHFMHLVKLNVLHLHLSDDQAFRLESKRFPRLHHPEQYYSQGEMRHLIEYARQRAIRIVPEFDMPAHTASWFVGYPQLASREQSSYQVETSWGVKNATMDVTRESTYDFLEEFLLEMSNVFPDPYFHIGGDECVPHEWLQSERIKKFIEENHLVDHQGLQAYFTRRVELILRKNKRTLMGWDEISASNLSHDPIIQSWRDKVSLLNAVQHGYRAVLSHGFYLDHMLSAASHYQNDFQVDLLLNDTERKRILGGEACLWTEYISSTMVHSRLWPRTAAIAERLWSSDTDQTQCMYERLTMIDERFFHRNDEQYMKELSTLASNALPLRLLADMCEPLGLQGRYGQRNYTIDTPLNRFVDILKPESEQTRRLTQTTDTFLLYSTFLSWKKNDAEISSNHSDIVQLSKNLVRLGEMGIRLLRLLERNQQRQIVSSRWISYQIYILTTIEYQVPEIRLAAVRVLRNLLDQFDSCAFDSVNLSLILFFPILVILVQRISFLRRRLLLPCLNFCHYYCARC